MVELFISVMFILIVGYLIAKNFDAKIVLFLSGLILLYLAVILKHVIYTDIKLSSGSIWLDPLKKSADVFSMQMGIVGLTIMILFGFAKYMTHIGANDAMVHTLSGPIKKIKSTYILVPIVFLFGNTLQMVLPSAAGLAILLMATLYPVLRTTGMSPLTAGAVIATTATIAPTPLGSDNIVVAQSLNISPLEYILDYHAKVSIPALIIMAFVHLFWQRYMDGRQGTVKVDFEIKHTEEEKSQPLPPLWYAILPILPILLLLFFNLAFIDPKSGKSSLKIGLVEITLISMIISLFIELIRKKNIKSVIKDFNIFFEGMGQGFSQVVSLIIAAGIFVEGLKAIGVINMLTSSLDNVEGAGSILMLFFSTMAALIGFISGSGIAVFHSFIKIIPEITKSMDVNTVLVALPMQLTSNLIRSVSPVSAVVIIVASVIKVTPIDIVKRTSIPIFVGIFVCVGLSYFYFS